MTKIAVFGAGTWGIALARLLAVNGRDLLALGYRGREIGQKLDYLLHEVMEGRLPNEKERLLAALKEQ